VSGGIIPRITWRRFSCREAEAPTV